MKNDNKKEVKSKTTLFFFMGMAASFLGSVTAAYVFIIPAKIDTFIDKKAEEKVTLKLEKIKLPSAVLFHEEIKECHDVPEPIKEKFLRHHPSDKILNQKKIYRKCVKIGEKALLRIESNAGSFIDPVILEHYQTNHNQYRAVGILINRIFIDEIKMAGETQTAFPPLSPEFSSSCQYSQLLEPGTYKIQVEAIFYGYLANPKVSVKLTALRVEPVNFINLSEVVDNSENVTVKLYRFNRRERGVLFSALSATSAVNNRLNFYIITGA